MAIFRNSPTITGGVNPWYKKPKPVIKPPVLPPTNWPKIQPPLPPVTPQYQFTGTTAQAPAKKGSGPKNNGGGGGGGGNKNQGGGGGGKGNGGGGGGQGGGGGGGKGPKEKTSRAEAYRNTLPDNPNEWTPAQARRASLLDALFAINAQYGMEKGKIKSQRGEVMNEYSLQSEELAEQKKLALREAIENQILMGTGTSSQAALDRVEVIKQMRDQQAQIDAELGSRRNKAGAQGMAQLELASAMQLLEQQREAAMMSARAQSMAKELDLESLLSLIGTGIPGYSFQPTS